MRYMAIADIHGNARAFKAAIKRYKRIDASVLLVAGDLTPRLSSELSELLGLHASCIRAVAGNCDTTGDLAVLPFSLPLYSTHKLGSKTIFLTHGHRLSPSHPPLLEDGDIFVSGHTHLPRLSHETESGIFLVNPGSISSPRGGFLPTYALITEREIQVCELYSDRCILSSLI